jgi:predicted O-methyltransferase YrrM
MKGNRILINEELYKYINNLYVKESELITNLKELYDKYKIPKISITPEQGKLLYIISKLTKAKKILEIGTLIGYSTLWLYESLPKDGILFTIEVSEKHYSIAKHFFQKNNLLDKINIFLGKAFDMKDILTELSPFDMVFLDADKEKYSEYYPFIKKLLVQGGVFIIDNTLSKGRVIDKNNKQKGVIETRKLNNLLSKSEEFDSILIPIADGLSIAIKK